MRTNLCRNLPLEGATMTTPLAAHFVPAADSRAFRLGDSPWLRMQSISWSQRTVSLHRDQKSTGARYESFGILGYVPGLDGQVHSLSIEGASKAGAEAAAESLSCRAFTLPSGQARRQTDEPDNHDLGLVSIGVTSTLQGDWENSI